MIFDNLENLETYLGTIPQLKTVAQALDHDEIYDKEPGIYTTPDKNVTYQISVYKTSPGTGIFEFHKKHTYVEIVLSGKELISTGWRELKKNATSYNESSDCGFFQSEMLCVIRLAQGRFSAFLPGEAFCPGVSEDSEGETVKKVVFKIRED